MSINYNTESQKINQSQKFNKAKKNNDYKTLVQKKNTDNRFIK